MTRLTERPSRFDRNLIVIGAGSAGLVCAYIAAALKAKVTLIEKHRMGGDCLNTGCVPSKALIRSAKIIAQAKRAEQFGFKKIEIDYDFAGIMERVQRVIRTIEPHDSITRYTELGVECIEGEARLLSPWTVEVNGQRLSARSIIVASGARPLVPGIPGIDQVEYLSSDTVWSLRELPRRLLVLGGGPIGCELSQCFARLGSQVTQVEMASRLLMHEDPEVSTLIAAQFTDEGVDIRTAHRAMAFEKRGADDVLICEHAGKSVEIAFDKLLVATGRRANVEGFGLEELGIRLNRQGTIETNAFMQTACTNIYACGDVTGPYQFTHTAAHQAWYATVNALFSGLKKFRADYSVIPWATFSDPEVARVGLNESEARERGIAHEITTYGIDDLDRAIADEAAQGFVKVLTQPGRDRILGATIVGEQASELITEYITAMRHGLGMNKILGTIHIYPTLSEANKYAAGVWKKAHAPLTLLKLVEWYHRRNLK